jgi:hypothetical protein
VDHLLTILHGEFDLTIQKVNDFAPGVKILDCQFYIGAPHFSKLMNILYLSPVNSSC